MDLHTLGIAQVLSHCHLEELQDIGSPEEVAEAGPWVPVGQSPLYTHLLVLEDP